MDGYSQFQQQVFSRVREGLDMLELLWKDLGYDEADVESRKEKVNFYMNDLIVQMVQEQDKEKVTVIAEIEGLLEKADKLSKELRVRIDVNFDETLPLLRVKSCLNDRLKEYLVVRAERVTKLSDLMDQAKDLSKAMGNQDFPHLPEVPSEQELESFQKLIRNANAEKLLRTETFKELRGKIMAAMDQMEQEPDLDFERQVVEGSNFVMSLQNMTTLREFCQKTERRLAETEELVAELREKLTSLWDRLNEPAELRANFLFGYHGIGKTTITAIRHEIARCEEKKRANIKQFVLSCRNELQDYWDKCHLGAEQRAEFRHFKSDMYVEDLLEIHEQELERVKQFYKDNLRLFTLVEQRKEIWERKAVLEGQSKSASRLYDNRGGKLLLEEKERKLITHKLPKIEEELRRLAGEYQREKGEPFLIEGKPLSEFITNQWEEHEAAKEEQKRERKVRNQTLGECSASKAGKRKLAATPSRTDAKRVRPDVKSASTKTPASIVMPRLQAVDVPERKAKIARRVFESKIAVRGQAGNQNTNPNTVAAAADTTTYTDFQVQLESGRATRSSAKLVSRDRNITYARTPIGDRNITCCPKTPIGMRTPLAVNTPTRTPLGVRSPAPLSLAKSRQYTTPARNKLPFLI